MLEIVEAPNQPQEDNKIKLFLAGGITNCPDWQNYIIDKFRNTKNGHDFFTFENVTVFNPRRKNFPINDPKASEEQITWEYKKLRESDIIIFWFSRGSLNPIVMLEYGKHGISQSTEIVVGIDDGYERKSDVEIQTKLAKPTQKICYKLDELFNEIALSIYNVIEGKNK